MAHYPRRTHSLRLKPDLQGRGQQGPVHGLSAGSAAGLRGRGGGLRGLKKPATERAG